MNMSRTSHSYNEILQHIADDYFAETGKGTATTKEIAVWAVHTRRWEAPPDLVLRKCREDIAKAMREQYILDEAGQPVRAKHVARITRGDQQLHLWADIRSAGESHMTAAFQQRREQIVGDCRQLKRDMDFYNGLHPERLPIQLWFDFRDDIEEGEFSTDYPSRRA